MYNLLIELILFTWINQNHLFAENWQFYKVNKLILYAWQKSLAKWKTQDKKKICLCVSQWKHCICEKYFFFIFIPFVFRNVTRRFFFSCFYLNDLFNLFPACLTPSFTRVQSAVQFRNQYSGHHHFYKSYQKEVKVDIQLLQGALHLILCIVYPTINKVKIFRYYYFHSMWVFHISSNR